MNDFEEEYTEGVEKEGEIFLEGLKNRKSLEELEKAYSKKVKEIRKIYEKSLKKDMKREEEREIEKSKNNESSPEKKQKEFQVQKLDIEKNWKDKKKTKVSSWAYRTKLKIRNFIRKITPNRALYAYYKTKRILDDFFRDFKYFFGRIFNKISKRISKISSYFKRIFIKTGNGLKLTVGKIINLIKKKEEGKNGKEKISKNPDNSEKKQPKK